MMNNALVHFTVSPLELVRRPSSNTVRPNRELWT